MIDWLQVDNAIAAVGFYLTTTSQFTLIFLTCFFVQKTLGHYRYLIILFSVMGIAFASIEFVLYPILHNYNGGYMFFTVTKPLQASNEVLMIMLVAYTGLYASTISLLAVQFIYRYVAVFDDQQLKYFQGWYFLVWILYVTWFGVEWALGLYIFAPVDDYTREYMRPEMASVYGYNISELPCYSVVVYITTPTIVLFSPIIFTIYSPLSDLKMSVPTGIFLSGFTLYPGFDAFILMYVITDYRRAFQQIANGARKSRSTN